MNGEFNGYCRRYYNLIQLLAAQDEHFNYLLDNAPPYTGQTNLDELDAIISHNRRVQRAKAKVEKTADDIRETEQTILLMMQYFEMPPGSVLKGVIAELLEYEIWADEKDNLFINKTKDLVPPQDAANIINIRLRQMRDVGTDDDEDWMF